MLIRDIVEELLGIQRSTKKEGEISIRGSDNIRKDIHGLGTAKGILVCQFVLRSITNNDLSAETFGNT
jgi:hypothetical protein